MTVALGWEFERRRQSCSIDVEGPLTLYDDDLMARAAADGHSWRC